MIRGAAAGALLAIALVAPGPAGAAEPGAAAPVGEWNFRALLDGKPIGQHRFSVSAQGDERQVVSDARFTVTFLGLSVYRYRHQATERWRGECLTALRSTTDDDGKASNVRAEQDGGALRIDAPTDAAQSVPGCVMSFAYWNPLIRTQTRLLNAQTGKLETVQVQRIGSGSIEVRAKPVAATEFRITGPAQPIELWYSAQGEWIGLDSIVSGGRRLSYRLE